MPNATRELMGTAGATQERTLFPVSSTRLFGPVREVTIQDLVPLSYSAEMSPVTTKSIETP
jgi:hypothetical protein